MKSIEDRWIFCGERLPKATDYGQYDYVLTSCGYYTEFGKYDGKEWLDPKYDELSVDAWMPIPAVDDEAWNTNMNLDDMGYDYLLIRTEDNRVHFGVYGRNWIAGSISLLMIINSRGFGAGREITYTGSSVMRVRLRRTFRCIQICRLRCKYITYIGQD